MASRDRAPLSLSGWPYNPRKRSDRAGMSKRDGGGKTMNKRAVWYERGNDGGKSVARMPVPKGKRQRRGF